MEVTTMASEKITAIVESVKTMTVLELKELVDTICEEFGVSAVACLQRSCSVGPRSACYACYAMCEVGFDSASCHKCLLYVVVGNTLEVESLRSAAYGFEQSARIFAHKDEHSLRWRLLKQLEQLVGACLVHTLGQPYYAYFISALARLQAQFARQSVALGACDYGLLVLGIHLCHPLFEREVWSAHYHFAPLSGVVVARGLMFRAHAWLLYGGIAEHEVGVGPLLQQSAMAQQFGCESHGKGHFAAAHRTAEEHCMWHAPLFDELAQLPFGLILAYHFVKLHILSFEF